MKLIIIGASGFVASGLVRLALRKPEITTIVAVSRKPVSAAPGTDVTKLRSVLVKDYGDFPEDVRKEFAGADACIWTVAITPVRAKMFDFGTVQRVCQTYTMEGLRAIYSGGPAKGFRFIYMSGFGIERDQSKRPWIEPRYSLMRGETENQVLAFAAEHKDQMEACVVKPALVTGPGYPVRNTIASLFDWTRLGERSISVETLSAAMLDQITHGFEKEPLMPEDLQRIGQKALQKAE